MKSLFFAILSLTAFLLQAQDKKGCDTTHPSYLTRFEGFQISECEYSEFREYEFIYYVGNPSKAVKEKRSGRFRRLFFTKSPNATRAISNSQLVNNYYNAIQKAKGKSLSNSNTTLFFKADGKEVYIELRTANSADLKSYNIVIIEVGAMEQEIVADINKAMEDEGRFALYGVYFDTGKSLIKPESADALNTVMEYLRSHPTEKIIIVGHTDNTGGYDANISLSKARAAAVKNWLVTNGKIDPARLRAEGAGQYCPVATKKSEAGRAKNRRVEVVLQ